MPACAHADARAVARAQRCLLLVLACVRVLPLPKSSHLLLARLLARASTCSCACACQACACACQAGLLVCGELLRVAASDPAAAQSWGAMAPTPVAARMTMANLLAMPTMPTICSLGPSVLPYLPPGGPVGAALLAVGAAVFGRNVFLLVQAAELD